MTTEEKEELKQSVLDAIKSDSQSVEDMETATTLENVNSLPAMQGAQLVAVPIVMLAQPAIDAAATATAAAGTARDYANLAASQATKAMSATASATAAADAANTAASNANTAASMVTEQVEETAAKVSILGDEMMASETVRFGAVVEGNVTTMQVSMMGEPDKIVYVSAKRIFVAVFGGKYYGNWGTADLYMNEGRTEILKDKIYLCGDTAWVWSDEKSALVELSGGGNGSGFYNVTVNHVLPWGEYYNIEMAVDILDESDAIEDEDKRAMIITFETAAGKWEDWRFVGTNTNTFGDAASWEKFGGGDAIKTLTITKGTETKILTPDETGGVSFDMPVVETDQTIEENSTNPVAGRAVAAKFKEMGGKYGAALKLNEIGEGDAKAYSLSLLDENGETLSTTDQFTGGGGSGSVAATKMELTRVSANPTVKNGDTVKLVYKYDQKDSTSGESTGNAGNAVITITHGANSQIQELLIAAGSTQEIDVTNYIGVGTNTVRVKVTTGEGDEAQVAQISWTVTVVQLTLTSSFNIAMVVNKGDVVTVPYALSGSGTKTLRCYVDGVDVEDRTITTSSANGSVSINTGSMSHGAHSVQMVAELELAGGTTIKSNSIYQEMAVRESGNSTAIIVMRYDYQDGSIIGSRNVPYIDVKQYDNYVLKYAVYDPKQTPTEVSIYDAGQLLSTSKVAFTTTQYEQRAMNYGTANCQMKCGTTVYDYQLIVEKSDLAINEPTDNMTLKLSAQGRSNDDTNKTEWSYNGIRTTFEGFKWGGDGWMQNALRHTDNAHTTIGYQPLKQPTQNVNNAMAFVVKYKVSDVTNEEAELIKCVDESGTGFIITSNEAKMVTKGKSQLSMKMAAGETYEVGFVSFPKAATGASDYETTNTEMVYLYINGIMSGGVQRGTSDSIYQENPKSIEMGAPGATLDVYMVRAYNTYLTDTQMLDCYIIDQEGVDNLFALYNQNNVLDDNGNITVDSVPDDMRYIIITGRQANGVATVMQAAVTNNKKTKFDVDDVLCIKRSEPALNFHLVGGCISLQGTSSLAYPIKNYRLYSYYSNKQPGQLYVGCNSQGVGGVLQEGGAYSFKAASGTKKAAAPVKCFCLKADYAESSSSHNTGMARLANDVLTQTGELTPAQANVDASYQYDVRTTIDGEPCLLFYRATLDDTPVFLGKFNFNNDKSTEAVFGFLDIPGYHDQGWVAEKFGGNNPTQCWEFLNNDYAMGMFLDDDFVSCDAEGTPNWQKVFEGRFPDGGTDLTYLQPLVSWVKSTNRRVEGMTEGRKAELGTKFVNELGNYFNVDYLCDYYVLTDVFGCVDQRVKNMMLAFFYDPKTGKVLGYFIFYDCDTINGVRNDGRLKYPWDVNEETIDTELSTSTKTVYAYAGHDSVLWANLRDLMPEQIGAAYKRLRAKMSNDTVFEMFDKEQSAKYCARIYNIDAINKYVSPKTKGVEVTVDGAISNVKYSYMEAMQGSRQSHRHWWLTNRFGLLDARYSTGQYTATDINWKGNSSTGAKVTAIAKREFYFELRREGDTMVHVAVGAGEEFSYTYNQVANVGTIFHLLGGAWMSALDLSEWGGFTDVNIPQLPMLETLKMGKAGTTYTMTELVIGNKLPMLKELDIRNYTKLPSLDLSLCSRLEVVNASGCTTLATMSFAEGSPLTTLVLPENYQTLTLRSLPKLQRSKITMGNAKNIIALWVENCALLNGFDLFNELFALGNLKYVRLTGLAMEGDGSDLKRWADAGLGGIDTEGNMVVKCKLCGTYRLTSYLSDEDYERYAELFDELNIRQPEYTMIEFDDAVADDANVSNLDNKTGYKYGNNYAISGHIATLLKARHRVLAKVTKKATTRAVRIADVDTTMNNLDGEMTYYPLDDENSNIYADGSAAKLDGTEGDWMMFEPFFWSKGINDYLNGKKYSCYSANDAGNRPSSASVTQITMEDLKAAPGCLVSGKKIMSGKESLASSYSNDSAYSVCKVTVSGYKKVRFPTVPGTNLMGSIFTDDQGAIIESIVVPTLNCKFEAGMYLISDVPSGSTTLYFTIQNTAEFDKVVLSNSGRIEDMEPEWVANDEHLCGVVGSSIVGTKLRSCITGGSTAANMTWTDFHYYSAQRGMQQIDALMHSRIANLAYARYGRRDMQEQCGAGQHNNMRTTGGTAIYGMMDTIGYEEAKTIKESITNSLVDNLVHQYAWYKTKDDYGSDTATQVNNICCLGYEDIYGHKYDMMDNVDMPNTSGDMGKWRIWMPDGSTRFVKGTTTSGYWITAVSHGKYMDVVSVGTANGSSSTYYSDMYWMSTAASRVVYRGYFSANAYGGVSVAVADSGASYAAALIGSRLAFRGKIVKASSVYAYKAMAEKA